MYVALCFGIKRRVPKTGDLPGFCCGLHKGGCLVPEGGPAGAGGRRWLNTDPQFGTVAPGAKPCVLYNFVREWS